MFTTVLIANRGEIALRIARTCRDLGIRTVAVYSTADRDSAVTRFADESVHIGPPAAKYSYLNEAAIIEAALRTGAEAIHPGYGFLSEDPLFAEACEAHGIRFIGPPTDVLERLGDKARARAVMAEAGLPVLPGSTFAAHGAVEAKQAADRIGYPVMIKAVAGGGGRGMTMVREARDFPRAYEGVRSDALAIFGDGRVYVERALETTRHVEVQILADGHGTVVHLGARDCSPQRRRQKLVEETPPPGLPDELVERICAAAVHGARSVGYVGAGTFEFLVDEKLQFHFMEANCRLQVEHPVTELVSGIDLVREQILVAAGARLGYRDHPATTGVAIECRVNAEDPEHGFRPTPGTIDEFLPPGGPFTRVDTHCFAGMRIAAEYDPLLAKVAVWAPTRPQAIARMERALSELVIRGRGVSTTVGFLRDILGHPLFRDAKHTTALVEQMGPTRR